MDRLAEARDEIRRGDQTSAEAMLDGILEGQEEITSHLLFDLTSAYEELLSLTGRYEDLIRKSRRCAEKAHSLPEMDRQIHSAHTLIVIALAERALGRSGDAARNARTAERLLSRFPAGHFSARSRERVNKLQVRLRSLQKALNDGVHGQSSKAQDSSSLSAPPLDWRNFASQRNFSSREVKACLAKIQRSAGPKESLAMLVDWAAVTPRAGSIGGNTGCFAAFVEELASITSGHALSAGTQCKLFQVLHEWEHENGSWLQRLINVNRKSGLREALQRLRRTLDAKLQLTLNAAETQLTELESNAGPDETNHQDCQRTLLQLESELGDLATLVPAASCSRLALLRNRLASFAAKIDQALRLRQEAYAKLLEEIAHAPSRSALANLRISIRQQLPEVHMHSQLQEALRQAEDRLLVTELESMERQERTAHLAKLDSARGVDLANLLFREYGVDLPTARKLVIDRNNGAIDLDGLLDSVVEVTRRTKQRHRGAPRKTQDA